FSRSAPRLAEWTAIRPGVVRLVQANEALIVVAPDWAEPNARFALGDELMPLPHVARADDSRFEHAVEVSILGQNAPELRSWQLETSETVGRFSLRRWKNPSFERVAYDFLEHAEPPSMNVSLERADATVPCTFGKAKVTNGDLQGHPTYPSQRFQCPGSEEQFVGLTVVEDEQYRPRRCLWAHPAPDGELVVRFDAVPLASRIRGHGGSPYYINREQHGSRVELSVRVAGEQLGKYEHRDKAGWTPFDFSTERWRGQTQPVEFRIHARPAWQRMFCFEATVR
ncbi:MAG TPA: hypothetical protein VG963_26205, partial [Polyangiaceae bacterium]|nr:hypothetical protein [Polyangiaceae bacterium]